MCRRRATTFWDRSGEDSDFAALGLKLCERGGSNAKKRAVVAVARKLSVSGCPKKIVGER